MHALAIAEHTVFVETGAGEGSAFTDDDYRVGGRQMVASAADAWGAPIVCKVKEPQPEEFRYLRADLVLFTYLHLAAYPAVAQALLAAGVTAIAYETVQYDDGRLPLLAPMSEIAGRMRRRWVHISWKRATAVGECCLAARPVSSRGKWW